MDLIFLEIVLVIVLAAVLGIIANLLRQPTILGFILTGIIIGPLILQEVTPQILDVMARFGVTLLLFIVGLELPLRELRTVNKAAFVTGLGQIIFTAVLGFFLSLFLGFTSFTSFYLAFALTFSSTIIVVKLLSDKRDLNSLYGKISIGILLIQDFVAITILILLSGISFPLLNAPLVIQLLFVMLKGLLLFIIVLFLSNSFFPRIVDRLAHSQELLFLVSLAWALGLAALVASPLIGFSIEIGGLLAGLSLANSSEHFQIAARIRPIRDFFIMVFFVILGMEIGLPNLFPQIIPALVFSLFVLIGNPLIVVLILGFLGYRKRTSFLTGLTVAQISEFSLILVSLGYKMGHLNKEIISLVALVGIITFTLSTYMILYGNKLYQIFSPYLGVFERKKSLKEQFSHPIELEEHVVLAGVNRMGGTILDSLIKQGERILVIDFNPDVIKAIQGNNVHSLFGDIADLEVLNQANLKKAKLVISTIPDFDDNLALLSELKKSPRRAKLIVTANSEKEAKKLYEMGADVVIVPHHLGGIHVAQLLKYGVI